MRIDTKFEREEDGRWIAFVPELPGVQAYGRTKKEAQNAVLVLAFRVVADKVAHGELEAAVLEEPVELPLTPV